MYDAVLDRILSRQLPGGTILQERRLADDLSVSRTPLREVLRRLEGEGLVVRVDRAVMVRALTITDYIDALRVRAVLEGEAAAQAAGKVSIAELGELRARIRGLMAGGPPEPAAHWALNDAVHDLIAAAPGNGLMFTIIRGLRVKTRMFNLDRMPDRFLPGCHEHLEILAALEKREGETARTLMVAHLEHVEQSIIRRLAER